MAIKSNHLKTIGTLLKANMKTPLERVESAIGVTHGAGYVSVELARELAEELMVESKRLNWLEKHIGNIGFHQLFGIWKKKSLRIAIDSAISQQGQDSH